jgi:hypothetical protein
MNRNDARKLCELYSQLDRWEAIRERMEDVWGVGIQCKNGRLLEISGDEELGRLKLDVTVKELCVQIKNEITALGGEV